MASQKKSNGAAKNMTVDVLICTKNSDIQFRETIVLDKCFEAIKKEIPYENIILVDAFSIDKTVEKAEEYFNDRLVLIESSEKLGKARQIGFENSKADWIFVIDSDVVVPENIWNMIETLTEKSLTENSPFRYDAIECDAINFYPSGKIEDSRRRKRGILCATLIKRKFLDGINIPSDLEVYEDDFIKRYLTSKGGRWFPSDIKVIHYPKEITPLTAQKVGYLSGKYRMKSFFTVLGGLIRFHDRIYFSQFKGWIKGRMI